MSGQLDISREGVESLAAWMRLNGQHAGLNHLAALRDALDDAADAIDRLTRERDDAIENRQSWVRANINRTKELADALNRAETAEAALSAARAELAECRTGVKNVQAAIEGTARGAIEAKQPNLANMLYRYAHDLQTALKSEA